MGVSGLHRNIAALLCLLTFGACQPPQDIAGASPDPVGEVSLDNGQRVFWAGGCGSCHATSPHVSSKTPALGGGHTVQTPYGVFRSSNISPDARSGIGGWSDQDFERAMRRGIAPDGRAYYPAFPYPSYARMSDQDLTDLHAYLNTLPPVANSIDGNQLIFPVNLPVTAKLWQRLFLRPGPVIPLSGAGTSVARGQYLVEGPGHCGTCHTPRNALGGPRYSRWLAGAEMPDGSGYAPNLTPDEDGLSGWSRDEIVDALHPFGSPQDSEHGMAAIRANLAHLPGSDLVAIAAYLEAVPPVASDP